MRLNPKLLVTACLIAAVIVLGVCLGWFDSPTPAPVSQSEPEQDTATAPERMSSSRFFTKGSQTRLSVAATNDQPAKAAATNADLLPDWQTRIDEVLHLETEPSEIGKTILEMLPRLPAEGRAEALQHTANLLADADYAPMGRLLSDPKTAPDELDILMSDILNRPNAVKLPLLLELARTPEHPKAGEASDILQVFLGDDRGENWSKWQEKVAALLEEEAPLAALETR